MKPGAAWIPQGVVVLAAAVFASMFFITALPRLAYPYDLDFIEDGMFMQAERVAQNQAVYAAPNADFNPEVYMPLFFWIGGLLIKLDGPSLPLLRSISLASTVVTTVVIYLVAWRESQRQWLALGCAGLFLGGYQINGFWYELARVDSLFVALVVGGLALGIYAERSRLGLVLSAIVLALAFLTKQTGLLVGAGLAVYLWVKLGWRALWFGLPFLVLSLGPILPLNQLTQGWFLYHVLTIGSADPIEVGRGVNYIVFEVFGEMAALSLMAIAAAWLEIRAPMRRALTGWRFWISQPWLLGIGMGIFIGGLGRIRVGGNLNDRMPAYALLCLAPALWGRYQGALPFNWPALNRIWERWPQWGMAGVILVQFGVGAYNPLRYIPTGEMQQAGDHLIQRIAGIPGPVLVLMHPYYAQLAGKQPATQIASLWYVRDRGTLPLPQDFVSRIRDRFYAAIISDESSFETEAALHDLVMTYYVPADTLDETEAPATTTGVTVRPQVVLRPRAP